MKILQYAIIVIITLAATALAVRPADLYKEGDVVGFRIERGGKVIGTQKATCLGVRTGEGDSLIVFAMETKTVVDRGGRSFDMDVKSEVGYRMSGLPRDYKFELTLLNAKVTHEGQLHRQRVYRHRFAIGRNAAVQFPAGALAGVIRQQLRAAVGDRLLFGPA